MHLFHSLFHVHYNQRWPVIVQSKDSRGTTYSLDHSKTSH